MKYLAIAALALVSVGCSREQRADVKAETEVRTESAADAWQNERREYSRRMQERLDRIDREMEEERVKAEGRKLNAKAKREYDEKMTELDKLKQETRERWNKVEAATQEGWNDFKRGMDETADKFDNAWERFKADLKS